MLSKLKKKSKDIDSFGRKNKRELSLDLPLARFLAKRGNASVLFSSRGRTEKFLTEHAQFYLPQKKYGKKNLMSIAKLVDSLFIADAFITTRKKRKLIYSRGQSDRIYDEVKERYQTLGGHLSDFFRSPFGGVTVIRMWNLSIVSSLIFGMFLMTMIYRYLGQGASANLTDSPVPLVLSAESFGDENRSQIADEITTQLLATYTQQEKEKEGEMEEEIRKMVKGYPIEKMIPFIAKKDKTVAAFIVGIAKQESDWGKRVPVYNGEDCYNYWGFKGPNRVGTGGHSCFSNPEEAVNAIAKRLEFLVAKEKVDTPNEMVVVWKCGYDCSWDKPENVKRWVGAVDTYFKKLES
jgi:hypothetical protein